MKEMNSICGRGGGKRTRDGGGIEFGKGNDACDSFIYPSAYLYILVGISVRVCGCMFVSLCVYGCRV